MKRTTISTIAVPIAAIILAGVSITVRRAADPPVGATPPPVVAEPVPSEGVEPSMPEIPERDRVTAWTRRDRPGGTRWEVTWHSDAVTAARVLTAVIARDDTREYALTPASDGGWILSAQFAPRAGGESNTAAPPTPPVDMQQTIAAVLERSNEPDRRAGETASVAEAAANAAPPPPDPRIGSGGSGIVRFSDGSSYRWIETLETVTLEPLP